MLPQINELYYCKKQMKYVFDDINLFETYQYYKVGYKHHGEVIMINNINEIVFSLERSVMYYYFYDYFYTKKEERKYKLNQLKYEIHTQ